MSVRPNCVYIKLRRCQSKARSVGLFTFLGKRIKCVRKSVVKFSKGCDLLLWDSF
jgi:hypothetical protein